ncbi:MAG: hypothetical protein ACRDTK_15070 [Mycobacterium sp.]
MFANRPAPCQPLSRLALWGMALTEILVGYYEPDEHARRRRGSLMAA